MYPLKASEKRVFLSLPVLGGSWHPLYVIAGALSLPLSSHGLCPPLPSNLLPVSSSMSKTQEPRNFHCRKLSANPTPPPPNQLPFWNSEGPVLWGWWWAQNKEKHLGVDGRPVPLLGWWNLMAPGDSRRWWDQAGQGTRRSTSVSAPSLPAFQSPCCEPHSVGEMGIVESFLESLSPNPTEQGLNFCS